MQNLIDTEGAIGKLECLLEVVEGLLPWKGRGALPSALQIA